MKPAARPLSTTAVEPITDVRELLRETLLNKEVLSSLDDILRTSIAGMTRVLELTGQPVEVRKRRVESINLRTRVLLGQLDELMARLCTLGDAHIEQGRPLTAADTASLISESEHLSGLCMEIDALLAEHTALWEQPQLRGKTAA
jgi:hypothetical protein